MSDAVDMALFAINSFVRRHGRLPETKAEVDYVYCDARRSAATAEFFEVGRYCKLPGPDEVQSQAERAFASIGIDWKES